MPPLKRLLLLALLVLAACGGRPAADDSTFHAAVQAGRAGAEVTFDATVRADPVRSGTHEHLRTEAATGEQVEIDHNLDLAGWVPAHAGDRLVVHGQLYIDAGRVGVHCTHAHTSRGCPDPGWIELGQSIYE